MLGRKSRSREKLVEIRLDGVCGKPAQRAFMAVAIWSGPLTSKGDGFFQTMMILLLGLFPELQLWRSMSFSLES
jgi:hypothetical protein